jgi:hypothetical protein
MSVHGLQRPEQIVSVTSLSVMSRRTFSDATTGDLHFFKYARQLTPLRQVESAEAPDLRSNSSKLVAPGKPKWHRPQH